MVDVGMDEKINIGFKENKHIKDTSLEIMKVAKLKVIRLSINGETFLKIDR